MDKQLHSKNRSIYSTTLIPKGSRTILGEVAEIFYEPGDPKVSFKTMPCIKIGKLDLRCLNAVCLDPAAAWVQVLRLGRDIGMKK